MVKDWVKQHRNHLMLGGAFGVIAVTAGTIIAGGATSGPMQVSQEAVDIFHGTPDEQVVSFYDHVCEQVGHVNELPRQFGQADVAVVGEEETEHADIYRRHADTVAADLRNIAEELHRINDNAPTDVHRVDGAEDGTNFRGALNPLVDYTRGRADGAVDTAERINAGEENPVGDELRDRVGEYREYLADTPAGMADPLEASMEQAAIFSEATEKQVRESENCAELFSDNGLDQDEVVESYVDFYATLREASEVWNNSLDTLRGYDPSVYPTIADAAVGLQTSWQAIADGSRNAAAMMDEFELNQADSDAGLEFAEDLTTHAAEAGRAYAGTASWAAEAAERVEQVGGGLDQALIEELTAEFNDKAIEQQRRLVQVGIDVEVPTVATADAVRSDGERAEAEAAGEQPDGEGDG